jgi:hypothetical protein
MLVGLLGLSGGCFAARSQSAHMPAVQVRAVSVTRGETRGKPTRGPATPVEESLHARGIRLGTDGSAPALFAYVREHFAEIPLERASRGDVIFFDLGSGCGGHAGLIETVEPAGRIGFRERRDGDTRHSYVNPRAPYTRRDERGRIANTFLRPKRMDDAPDTRYFAGEMACALFHVETPP